MFKAIGRAISRPVRGVGRMARGAATGDFDRIRKGFGDLGEGVAEAAPLAAAVPGVGTVAAAGMRAGGRAAQRLGEEGANLRSVGRATGQGALEGAAGAVAGNLAGRAAGALPGGPSAAAGQPMGAAGDHVGHLAQAGEGLRAVGRAAPEAGATAAGGAGGAAGEGFLGRAGGWISENPELSADIAGTALEAYGAHRDDRARSRQLSMQEEHLSRGWGQDDASRRAGRRALSRRRGG